MQGVSEMYYSTCLQIETKIPELFHHVIYRIKDDILLSIIMRYGTNVR